MGKRSTGFWILASVGSCLFLLLCLLAVGFGVLVYSQQAGGLTGATLPPVNRIVFVGNDRNIYIGDPTKHAPVALTQDADSGASQEYDFPTWSPDSRQVAFVGYGDQNNSPDAGVFNVLASGGKPVSLFRTSHDFPVYLYWAPDSRHLSFLTQKGQSLALRMAKADTADSAQELDSGQPLYWAWSPSGQTLLLHVGSTSTDSRVALWDWPANPSARKLPAGPGSFQSPQWTADGQQVLFASSDGSAQEMLNRADFKGEQVAAILHYQGRIAFAASPAPQASQVAYVVTPAPTRINTFGPLRAVATDASQDRELTDENVLAFFWSPDGKRLAYLVPTLTRDEQGDGGGRAIPALQDQQLFLRWRVVDADGQNRRTVVTFLPTEKILFMLPFFDQYAHSNTFWSPDSKALVYASRDSDTAGTVWVIPVEPGGQPQAIGEGVIGFWSWR